MMVVRRAGTVIAFFAAAALLAPAPVSAVQTRAADPETLYNEGLVAYNRKDFNTAISSYTEAINAQPDFADAYFNRSLAYFGVGDTAHAIADVSQVIGLKPRLADAYSNRGFFRYSAKNYDGAIADYTAALALKPDLTDAVLNRANCCYYKGAYDNAITDYKRYLSARPNVTSTHLNIGLSYLAKKDYANAIAGFTTYIKAVPTDTEGYVNRGDAYAASKQYTAAIDDYTRYLSLSPEGDNGYGFNARALAFFADGQFIRASEDWRAFSAINPTDKIALYNLGVASTKADQLAAAADAYSRLIGLEPGNLTAYNRRAEVYLKLGKPELGVADYTSVIERQPECIAYHNRATAYTRLTPPAWEKAVADFTECIRELPDQSPGYGGRAVAYDNLNENEKAIADYRMYLALSPDARNASQVRRRIAELGGTGFRLLPGR